MCGCAANEKLFQERKKGRVLGRRKKVLVSVNSISLDVVDGEIMIVKTINSDGDSESGQANKEARGALLGRQGDALRRSRVARSQWNGTTRKERWKVGKTRDEVHQK